jgi:hypothetical protein
LSDKKVMSVVMTFTYTKKLYFFGIRRTFKKNDEWI